MTKAKLECDNCGHRTKTGHYDPFHEGKDLRFCDLCADTFGSKASYASMNSDTRLILKVICGVGNKILDAIRKSQEGKAASD